MSWTDRDFNQSKYNGRWSHHPVVKAVAGSVPLGTWFGIRMRAHASLLWFVALVFLYAGTNRWLGWKVAMTGVTAHCALVVLHEFGHCFASHLAGGRAEEVILWPLGGLGLHGTPSRPGAYFVAALGGPFVNFLVCGVAATTLLIMHVKGWEVAWNPLRHSAYVLPPRGPAFAIAWIFLVSWILLLCNLLPILPLDGGQVAFAALLRYWGQFRSLNFAYRAGMIASLAVGICGTATQVRWMILALAVMLWLYCLQQRLILRQILADAATDEEEFADSFAPDRRSRRRKLSRRIIARCRRRAEQDRAELERVDQILAKVSSHGMKSLTWLDRRTLRKATQRQRRTEADLLGG